MDELIKLISDCLGAPYIKENDAVMDGCFGLAPYYSDALIGNGAISSVVNHYSVDIFYENKSQALAKTVALWKMLNSKSNYCCENPDYTYEKNAALWHSVLRVQEVSND